jgi:DnaJ-domain-containing protein 1
MPRGLVDHFSRGLIGYGLTRGLVNANLRACQFLSICSQKGERAQQRAAKAGQPAEPSRPVTENEAFALLGVGQGCTPDELAHAYHLTMSQWHPDKLETMAPELKDYATRQTQRINEAYQKLKSTTMQNRTGSE